MTYVETRGRFGEASLTEMARRWAKRQPGRRLFGRGELGDALSLRYADADRPAGAAAVVVSAGGTGVSSPRVDTSRAAGKKSGGMVVITKIHRPPTRKLQTSRERYTSLREETNREAAWLQFVSTSHLTQQSASDAKRPAIDPPV